MKSLATLLLALAALTMTTFAADGPVRHIVHFKFKADATPEQIKHITDEFAALKTKISQVESLDWGINSSPEGLSKDFKYCWIVSFKNTTDRDAYLVHPAHQAFVTILKPLLDDVMVVDFIPEK